jgi:hypothetical protein
MLKEELNLTQEKLDIFEKEKFNGCCFFNSTREDLQSCGIQFGPAKRIEKFIKKTHLLLDLYMFLLTAIILFLRQDFQLKNMRIIMKAEGNLTILGIFILIMDVFLQQYKMDAS